MEAESVITAELKLLSYVLNDWIKEGKDGTKDGVVWGTTGHIKVANKDNMIVSAMMFVRYAMNRDIILSVGGADGWDTLVLNGCMENKVPFILRLPFKKDLERLSKFVDSELCIEVTYEKNKYEGKQDKGIFFVRNRKIIDDAVKNKQAGQYPVIGTHWDGRQKGGTFDTIKQAIKQCCIIYNFYNMQWYTVAGFRGHL